MHIAEGILSPPLLVGGAVIATAGISLGLKQIKNSDLPQISLLSALFYLASLIHVPIGPSSGHLMLAALLAILLKAKAGPAILIALFLQFLTFQHGGLTTLGVNWSVMALPAITLSYLFGKKAHTKVGSFIFATLSILLSSLLLVGSLMVSGKEYQVAASVIMIGNVPIAIVEGIITMVTIQFIIKVKPEVLSHD